MKPRRKRGRKSASDPTAAPPAVAAWTLPAPPDDLGDFGQSYWRTIGPQLVAAGVLVPVHADTFRALCAVYDEFRRLDEYLREDPSRYTFTTETGYEAETPQVRIRDRALATLQKLWAKFGLTPHALVTIYKSAGLGARGLPELEAFAAGKYDEDPPEPD